MNETNVSIIMPVFDGVEFVEAAIASVFAQSYENWELCIADDCSADARIEEILLRWQDKDNRVRVKFRDERGHICRATNSALELATGDWVVFLDQDDRFSPDALSEVVSCLSQHPDADLFYSDEDKIDSEDTHFQPFLKPQWSPETLLSRMYLGHLLAVRRSILLELGGVRVGFEGAQDYDLVLRLSEITDKIYRIPKILYHWRSHSDSTAGDLQAKPYAVRSSRKAMAEALQRRGEPGRIVPVPSFPNYHVVRFDIEKFSRVSIIIANLGGNLDRCLQAIFSRSTYPDWEVIVVGDTGDLGEWKKRAPERLRLESVADAIALPRLYNIGASLATGEYLFFLNANLEVITRDWLEAAIEQMQRQPIAIVGGLLLQPHRTIASAGKILSGEKIAVDGDRNSPAAAVGYLGRVVTINNVSAVSGDGLACRREVFVEVGGFDEGLDSYSDIDLCLKCLQAGYRNVYLPHLVLQYITPGDAVEGSEAEKEILRQRWGDNLYGDRYAFGISHLYPTPTVGANGVRPLSKIVIVTGMHRSGTSLLASYLNKGGIDFGKDFIAADRFNRKGYFEDADFVSLQRAMVARACNLEANGWPDWGWTEAEEFDISKLEMYRESAWELIRDRDASLWGWKDPRTTLLLDFWDGLLPDACYIFIYRFPWDVADSIARLKSPVFNQHPEYAVKIWHFYNRRLLEFYQKHGDRCLLVSLDGFVRNPDRLRDLVAEKFGISLSGNLDAVFDRSILTETDWNSSAVRLFKSSAPDAMNLLADLDGIADLPSQIVSLQGEPESRANAIRPYSQDPRSRSQVSIVVPCYNDGEYLLEAIASIENCQHDSLEVIIINDGSDDKRTLDILAYLDTRGYRILEQENRGLADARNLGIENSSGDYILPLDADNRLRPDFIAKATDILDRDPEVGVVYGWIQLFGDDSEIRKVPRFEVKRLLFGNFIDACAVFRRQIWYDAGGYDSDIPDKLGYEDWDMWLSATEAGWKFHCLQQVTFEYRVRSRSMVSRCNEPENRRRLFRYICRKHRHLYFPYMDEILAEKEFVALRETQRSESMQVRLQLISEPTPEPPPISSQLDPPLVSVCIPTYNGDRYLEEALASVRWQTYPHLEVIVSDNGSDDRTLSMIDSFRSKCDRDVFVYLRPQQGIADNWNFCISKARGTYIKFLFQDDVLEANCIEEMVNLAEEDEDIGLVFSPRLWIRDRDAKSDPTLQQVYQVCADAHRRWQQLERIQAGSQLLGDPNLLVSPFNKIGEPSTVLLKKDALETVGGFDRQLKQLVDLELWWRILTQYKVGFVEKPLSRFRLHKNQQTYKNLSEPSDDRLLFYKRLANDRFYSKLPLRLRIQFCCRYYLAVVDGSIIIRQQVREKLAKLLAIASTEEIETIYLSDLRPLLNVSDGDIPLSEWERDYLQGFSTETASAIVLIMLYRLSDVKTPEFAEKPGIWFGELATDYLHWRLNCDRDRLEVYCRSLEHLLEDLVECICRDPDSPLWQTVALNFAVSPIDFIPLYTQDVDLTSVYQNRAAIVEFSLSSQNHSLEWNPPEGDADRPRIRMGILTPHLQEGLSSFETIPLFGDLDRNRFETILYTFSFSGTGLERYCESCVDAWVKLPKDLRSRVNLIREDNLDVLIVSSDIVSRNNSTLLLAAHRLAKLQIVSSLSPACSQLRHCDRYLPDSQTTETDPQYPTLPGSGLCFSSPLLEPPTVAIDPMQYSASSELVRFLTAETLVTPEAIDLWMQILSAVPYGVLLILVKEVETQLCDRLQDTLAAKGDDPRRIVPVSGLQNVADLHVILKIADLYGDIFSHYNNSTILAAVQAGLPIVTKLGKNPRSRSLYTLLKDLDLAELATDSNDDFIRMAIELGNNRDRREKLAEKIKSSGVKIAFQ